MQAREKTRRAPSPCRILRGGLILACLLAGGCALPGLAASPAEGRAAPGFEVKSLDGRLIDSAQSKGKVVMLHFWATWCPPCREEMPLLEKFYQAHRKDGFEVVAISIEDAADEAKVREVAKAFNFPVAMRSAAKVEGYGRIWSLPLSFVIDRKGVLRKSDWSGELKIDASSLAKNVLPLLDEP